MFKVMAIHIVAFLIAFAPIAEAMQYDVDMPNSGDRKFEVIRITVDSCESKFKIKKEDFPKVAKNTADLQKMVKKAIERSRTGCGTYND